MSERGFITCQEQAGESARGDDGPRTRLGRVLREVAAVSNKAGNDRSHCMQLCWDVGLSGWWWSDSFTMVR